MSVLAGGVFAADTDDELSELRGLVDDIGARSAAARIGRRRLPELFDETAWRNLEETGLSRLTTDTELDAGPRESAVLLRGLARHAVSVPLAETDLLAGWLAGVAGLEVPTSGPLTLAQADAGGGAAEVPWSRDAVAIVVAVRDGDRLLTGVVNPASVTVTPGHNLGGEPRDDIDFDLSANDFRELDLRYGDELDRRGAWARCVQCIGALDAAAELAVAHTRDRVQFGRPLSKFQAVQHALAGMAGEIERARAATELAVAAAADYGFDSAQTDYAVTLAKVALGQVVPAVSMVAHQLHGAIGVTIEHPLWSATNRAHSWITEFGSTGAHARKLGWIALSHNGADLWDVLTTGQS
ncbi:MAG TPA: acyl-CoA dehydrogenase [Mycobacterium sp.]|nr:acyl-CoA dehydrogenase [Mycobacterium sp.]